MSDSSFLTRWSRRKTAMREGHAVPDEPEVPVAPAQPEASPPAVPQEPVAAAERPSLPDMADVALLKPGDSIARFIARGVDENVKRAALKTLFADPHFNVMDGLDTYIDDYGKPDPIPAEVLRRLWQSEGLGLFKTEEEPVDADPAEVEDHKPDQSPETPEPGPDKHA